MNPYESPSAESPPAAPRFRRATACPHCGETAVTLFQKSRIEPIRNARCRVCGGRVGVSWRWVGLSSLAGLLAPIGLLLLGWAFFSSSGRPVIDELRDAFGYGALMAIGVTTALLGGGLQVGVQAFFAPLIKK